MVGLLPSNPFPSLRLCEDPPYYDVFFNVDGSPKEQACRVIVVLLGLKGLGFVGLAAEKSKRSHP